MTKPIHKFTATTMTPTAAELAYHRARIDKVARLAKTAVRIDERGRRRVVRRRKNKTTA